MEMETRSNIESSHKAAADKEMLGGLGGRSCKFNGLRSYLQILYRAQMVYFTYTKSKGGAA